MPRKSLEEQARLAACKVKKKGIESKRANMEKVRDLIDAFQYCFVFDIENFRNPLMKQLKNEWETSRFFGGKVKPTIVALGKNSSDEYRGNLHLVSNSLQYDAKGAHRGLFFTNESPSKVIDYFNKYKVTTFAKTGFVATNDFIVKQGHLDNFVFSQEYTLRKLGLTVILRNGKLCLDADFTICKRGQPLTPEQCKLLELFNQPQAEFKVRLHSYWKDEIFHTIGNKQNNANSETNENEVETKLNENDEINMFENDEKESKTMNDASDIKTNSFGSGILLKNKPKYSENTNNNDANDIAAFINENDDTEEEDDDVI